MNENLIRDRLNLHIKLTGIKAKFLAKKLGINESIFCRFRKGNRDLYIDQLIAIKSYLDSVE